MLTFSELLLSFKLFLSELFLNKNHNYYHCNNKEIYFYLTKLNYV